MFGWVKIAELGLCVVNGILKAINHAQIESGGKAKKVAEDVKIKQDKHNDVQHALADDELRDDVKSESFRD